MAMKCNRFVTNSLIFNYRSVLTSVGERINNEEKKKNHYWLYSAVMFAMLCMPQRAEAARKAVWKDVDGVWYAYRGSKLVRNKWVGDYYAGSDGFPCEKSVDRRVFRR